MSVLGEHVCIWPELFNGNERASLFLCYLTTTVPSALLADALATSTDTDCQLRFLVPLCSAGDPCVGDKSIDAPTLFTSFEEKETQELRRRRRVIGWKTHIAEGRDWIDKCNYSGSTLGNYYVVVVVPQSQQKWNGRRPCTNYRQIISTGNSQCLLLDVIEGESGFNCGVKINIKETIIIRSTLIESTQE